jgi:sulfate/thiosulfate-binding protein
VCFGSACALIRCPRWLLATLLGVLDSDCYQEIGLAGQKMLVPYPSNVSVSIPFIGSRVRSSCRLAGTAGLMGWARIAAVGLFAPFLGCSTEDEGASRISSGSASSGSNAGNSSASASGESNGGKAPVVRQLTNVSYDPTRELYAEFNEAFARHWLETRKEVVEIAQSHGGSGKQSRAVIEGLDADIVSLALSGDIDAIAEKTDAIPTDWQNRLPNNSSPYTSTIVFLVRKGNPKNIRDWDDLVRDGVEVITPNPKTGGGARWNYLAAWGYALNRELGDLKSVREDQASDKVVAAVESAKKFIGKLYKNVPILDTSARAATNTFLQRSIGDVLITWENEAFLAMRELGSDQVEMIIPSLSILAEPPVAVVDRNAKQHGTEEVAKAYLDYLYTDVGQRIVAKHFYRPRNRDAIASEDLKSFADVRLFELTDVVSNWKEAHDVHFKERTGVFDQVYSPNGQ